MYFTLANGDEDIFRPGTHNLQILVGSNSAGFDHLQIVCIALYLLVSCDPACCEVGNHQNKHKQQQNGQKLKIAVSP